MISPRRFLPSIGSLRALEAVERLGSASAAAQELSVTQSAVSRQLKAIEDHLEVELIVREKQRLHLTPAALDYVGQVRDILGQLARASLKLKASPTGGSLDLAILPAFGMHWLAPRLSLFARDHPEVTINLSTRLQPFDFASEPFDAAIHFGERDWLGVDYLPIMPEQVVPVCAPDLLHGEVKEPTDLLRYPLLHLETRPDAWERWFSTQGSEVARPAGMLFDQFSTMAQAVIYGLGVALLPTYLVEGDLARGKVRVAWGGRVESVGSYYLVWPTGKAGRQPLGIFRDWLSGQVAAATAAAQAAG